MICKSCKYCSCSDLKDEFWVGKGICKINNSVVNINDCCNLSKNVKQEDKSDL